MGWGKNPLGDRVLQTLLLPFAAAFACLSAMLFMQSPANICRRGTARLHQERAETLPQRCQQTPVHGEPRPACANQSWTP